MAAIRGNRRAAVVDDRETGARGDEIDAVVRAGGSPIYQM